MLWPVRAAACLSLPPILALSCLAETRGLAAAMALALGFPYLLLLALLSLPDRRRLVARALELAIMAAVIGTAVFGMLMLPASTRERLPLPAGVVCWSFPIVQAGLLVAARRARKALPGPALTLGMRVVVAAALFIVPLGLNSPLLLGAHPHGAWWANEAQARAEMRELLAAQFAFSAAVAGGFGPIGCLTDPPTGSGECPDLPPGSTFLRSSMRAPVRAGYRFALHLGRTSEGHTFAYTAVPVSTGDYPGWMRTGRRSFCSDSTGRICSVPDGVMPGLQAGLCAASCPTLD